MTDILVPETTAPEKRRLQDLIGAVVRTKVTTLGVVDGTKAIVCDVRETGRYQVRVVVPGFPFTFWLRTDQIEVVEMPANTRDSWKLLESN